WVMATTARSSTGPCGTNSTTLALAGASTWVSPDGMVATTVHGSSARPANAVRTSTSSFWYSEEVVTRAVGVRASSSHPGGSRGGSHGSAPIIRILSPQSSWGYSNGSDVVTSMRGARR